MSSAEYFSNLQPINPYYADETVDLSVAAAEHDAVQAAMAEASISVTKVDAPPDSQDGVYTANWALVRGTKAVLARLPDARKTEEKWAEQTLTKLGYEVITVPNNWKFSGQGDALACGDYLFCGQGYRSDVQAQAFAAKELGYTRIQLQTIPQLDEIGAPVINEASGWADSFYYDIDLALAIIKGPSEHSLGTIAYCRDAFTLESQKILDELDGFEKIIVNKNEAEHAFACNLVSTGEAVVMSATATDLQQSLKAIGMRLITPSVHELVKGGGYIRCVSLNLSA